MVESPAIKVPGAGQSTFAFNLSSTFRSLPGIRIAPGLGRDAMVVSRTAYHLALTVQLRHRLADSMLRDSSVLKIRNQPGSCCTLR
jgi:hypothetical protein